MVFVYQKNVSDTTTIPEEGAGRINYLQTEVYEYHHRYKIQCTIGCAIRTGARTESDMNFAIESGSFTFFRPTGSFINYIH